MASSPRPILKRTQSAPHNNSSYPPNHNQVHFPPHPSLTRVFSAHSASAYDRSPIVVTPNSCALPERGCPGRTYYANDGNDPASSNTLSRSSCPLSRKATPQHSGRCLHPRAANFQAPPNYRDEQPPTTSRMFPQTMIAALNPIAPPISHDFSSESDESDGFIPHPPGLYHPPQVYPSRNRLSAHTRPTDTRDKYQYYQSASFDVSTKSGASAFLPPSHDAPYPPPPPNYNMYDPPPEKDHSRRRKKVHHDRNHDRDTLSTRITVRTAIEEAEEDEDDEGEVDLPDIRSLTLGTDKDGRRRSGGSKKKALASYRKLASISSGFGASEDAGCLGGF